MNKLCCSPAREGGDLAALEQTMATQAQLEHIKDVTGALQKLAAVLGWLGMLGTRSVSLSLQGLAS